MTGKNYSSEYGIEISPEALARLLILQTRQSTFPTSHTRSSAFYLSGGSGASTAKPGIEDIIREQSKWLDEKHKQYVNAMSGAEQGYSNVIDSLIQRINNPDTRISFGLSGYSPVSVVPRSVYDEARNLLDLAEQKRTSSMRVPLEQWAWAQQNPLYSDEMKVYDLLNSLYQADENRRYGIAGTTDISKYTVPEVDFMTRLAALGTISNLISNMSKVS